MGHWGAKVITSTVGYMRTMTVVCFQSLLLPVMPVAACVSAGLAYITGIFVGSDDCWVSHAFDNSPKMIKI